MNTLLYLQTAQNKTIRICFLKFDPKSHIHKLQRRYHIKPESINRQPITKTRLYSFDPLKPFYTVKLGFTGVYINFLISAQKHKLWVLVRTASPRRF